MTPAKNLGILGISNFRQLYLQLVRQIPYIYRFSVHQCRGIRKKGYASPLLFKTADARMDTQSQIYGHLALGLG